MLLRTKRARRSGVAVVARRNQPSARGWIGGGRVVGAAHGNVVDQSRLRRIERRIGDAKWIGRLCERVARGGIGVEAPGAAKLDDVRGASDAARAGVRPRAR